MASWRATSSWYKGVIQAPHDVPPYVHHYRPSYGQFNDCNVYLGWCNEWHPYGPEGFRFTRGHNVALTRLRVVMAPLYMIRMHPPAYSSVLCPLLPASLPPPAHQFNIVLLFVAMEGNRLSHIPSIFSKISTLWRGQCPVSCCTLYELTLDMQTYQGFPFILPSDTVYQITFPWFTPV